jgi:hypothetical protein
VAKAKNELSKFGGPEGVSSRPLCEVLPIRYSIKITKIYVSLCWMMIESDSLATGVFGGLETGSRGPP